MTAVDPGIGVFVSPSQMPVPDSSIKELRTSNTVFIVSVKVLDYAVPSLFG